MKAQLINDPHTVDAAGLLNISPSSHDTYTVRLVFRDNHIALQYKEDVDIAILNTKITNVLRDIEDLGGIRYEAFVTAEDFTMSIIAWKKKGKAVDFPLEIVLYGSLQIRDDIGKRLSDAEIYLQHPRCCSNEAEYDNPHYLKIGRVRRPALQLLSPSLTPLSTPERLALNIEFNGLLDCLDQQENLGTAWEDSRIKTALLRYSVPCDLTLILSG